MLNRLEREHTKLRTLATALSDLVASKEPCDFDELSRRRWELARMVHLHLVYEDRQVFQRLEQDPRCEAREISRRCKQDIERLHVAYREHVVYWSAAEMLARWPEFQRAVRDFTIRMRMRLDREEQLLFPLLTDVDDFEPCRRPDSRNWAADGLAMQNAINVARCH